MNPKLARALPLLVQCVLVAPALVPCSAAAAKVLFGWEALNDLFGIWEAHPAAKVLFSPWVVLGGLVASVGWNVWQLCRVSFERIHERWVFCLSVRHELSNLGWMTLGTALLMAVAAYAVAENVVITLRPH